MIITNQLVLQNLIKATTIYRGHIDVTFVWMAISKSGQIARIAAFRGMDTTINIGGIKFQRQNRQQHE